MGVSGPAKAAARHVSLRSAIALLALVVIASGGFFLRQSEWLESLAEYAMREPPVRFTPPPPDYVVRVVDERGQPVPSFAINLRTGNKGSSGWDAGTKGEVKLPGSVFTFFRQSAAIDVLVRAEGFATTFARFAGSERDKLFAGKATLTLREGEEVALHLRPAQGQRWPAELMPEIFFSDHRNDVRIMWQPRSRRAYLNRATNPRLPDLNFLNVKEAEDGHFTFRLDRHSDPFYVAVHRPGFLQFFEAGPFTLADVAEGVLEIDLPEPATLDLSFDPGTNTSGGLPFDGVTLKVTWKLPNRNAFLQVVTHDRKSGRQKLHLSDLAPGTYQATVLTRLKDDVGKRPSATARPGIYRDTREVILAAGEGRQLKFDYVPFDANVFRGNRTAKIHVANPDGSPAARRRVRVQYVDENFGYVEAFSGKTSRLGELEIKGITDRKPKDATLRAYEVEMDGHRLGAFSFSKWTQSETFSFHLPPVAGDVAPDIELVNASTGAQTRLRDLRGQVVCLELWSTWCGPCQLPMRKLNELASEDRETWRGRVAMVPVSIDERPKDASQHAKQRMWDSLDHYWSGADGATGFNAPAMRALVVRGVPTSFLINREGRIVWRGHPGDTSDGKDLATRIEEALDQ